QADALGKNLRIVDLQHMTAFVDNARGRRWIDSEVVAHLIRAAKNTIVRARDCVHERRIVAHNRAQEIVNLWNDGDLAAMRLKIGILNESTRPDSGAIDHEIEFATDIFEFVEANIRLDFAAGFQKSLCEIIEINGGVHERNVERETACEHRVIFTPP